MRCYEIAPPRIQQFLEAEIGFVLEKISEHDNVLDLGCGYGRVSVRLISKAKEVAGIDISKENIILAKKMFSIKGLRFYEMDANDLIFEKGCFDVTLCLQNGISAFKIDPLRLVSEALRVTKKGGRALFSTYSSKIWDERLKWFRIQSEAGLIGEIDDERTGNGVIICKDGFKAITYSEDDFMNLASHFPVVATVYEVDDSCLFCEIIKR
jgi:2-polyprenyl-6-hydroxyphenyl methylase/3-demethylubiquinone-9 3-methyltransferase